jgi:hypothetical protein
MPCMAWRRTSKFTPRPGRIRGFMSTRIEVLIAVSIWGAIAGIVVAGPTGGLAALLLQTAARQSLSYVAAPAVALLAEHDLRAGERDCPSTVEIEIGSPTLSAAVGSLTEV